ncbi:MAG: acyloxyacyl hydrolase [Gammaproteobacteria bacterium]
MKRIVMGFCSLFYPLVALSVPIEHFDRWAVSFASGYGVAHIKPLRFGIMMDWNRAWKLNTAWTLGGYFELSHTQMPGRSGLISSKSRFGNSRLHATALAATARFYYGLETIHSEFLPFIDLGFGASWLSKKEIGGRELGIYYQFEDRLGAGFRFGKQAPWELGYRAIHFSNAYLGPKNHGINLHLLVLSYWF